MGTFNTKKKDINYPFIESCDCDCDCSCSDFIYDEWNKAVDELDGLEAYASIGGNEYLFEFTEVEAVSGYYSGAYLSVELSVSLITDGDVICDSDKELLIEHDLYSDEHFREDIETNIKGIESHYELDLTFDMDEALKTLQTLRNLVNLWMQDDSSYLTNGNWCRVSEDFPSLTKEELNDIKKLSLVRVYTPEIVNALEDM